MCKFIGLLILLDNKGNDSACFGSWHNRDRLLPGQKNEVLTCGFARIVGLKGLFGRQLVSAKQSGHFLLFYQKDTFACCFLTYASQETNYDYKCKDAN